MSHDFNEASKLLKVGRNRLFKILKKNNVLMKNNLPKQRFIDRGYFEVKHKTYVHPTVGTQHYGKPYITGKGLIWIDNNFKLTPKTTRCENYCANHEGAAAASVKRSA